jgi:hypothetical protein
MKTRIEIDKLKEQWKKDPDWDIECTEGFEDHVEELLSYRKEVEAELEAKHQAKAEKRADYVRVQTGVLNADIVSALHTWNDIENEVGAQDRYIGRFVNVEDQVIAELKQAQVRAMLLLAAQVKRVADAIEAQNENEQVDFMTRLYKVD